MQLLRRPQLPPNLGRNYTTRNHNYHHGLCCPGTNRTLRTTKTGHGSNSSSGHQVRRQDLGNGAGTQPNLPSGRKIHPAPGMPPHQLLLTGPSTPTTTSHPRRCAKLALDTRGNHRHSIRQGPMGHGHHCILLPPSDRGIYHKPKRQWQTHNTIPSQRHHLLPRHQNPTKNETA